MTNKRIISLLPSATEIIYALSAEKNLVGRSHECDFPSDTQNIPIVTKSSIHNEMSSAVIDAKVKQHIEQALSLYELNWELIKELQPDVIITQDQCEVCAVHAEDLKSRVKEILQKEVQIVSLSPKSIEDVLKDIADVAALLNIDASDYIEELNDRIDIVKHKVKFVKHRPEIVCIEWMEPLMTAGHWTPQLIDYAGGKALLSEAFSKSRYIGLQEIIEANPDGIIIAPCGFDLERTKNELHLLMENPQFKKLKAVEKGHVFIADGNAYFNRSGPRLVDTLEMIAEILQVNQFYYGFENQTWEQLSAIKN